MYQMKALTWTLTALIPVTAAVSFAYGSWLCNSIASDDVSRDTFPKRFKGRAYVATPEAWWS
jgi:hypothetical protein